MKFYILPVFHMVIAVVFPNVALTMNSVRLNSKSLYCQR